MLRNNLGYKLIAFGIGLTIWAYSNGTQSARVSREIKGVPLSIQNLEPGCSATTATQVVSVTLEGQRGDVSVAAAQIAETGAYVNLQGKRAGTHTVPVLVKMPSGLTGLVTALPSPRRIKVTVLERSQRSLDVQAQFAILPSAGYEFGIPEINPARVTVSGPAEHVRNVARVVVVVDRKGPDPQRVQGEFTVYALDRDGKHVPEVTLSPDKVRVLATMQELPASRVVFVSLSVRGQPPFPYRVADIEIQPQTVTVTGKPALLSRLTTLRTETLDLNNRTTTFTGRVGIVVPEGVSLAGERSARVTIRIETAAEPEGSGAAPPGD